MTSSNCYDVIVLGLGGMGSASLWHLAERGVRVCGIDVHTVPHDFGSSHGTARVIRKAYFEHPDYIPLLDRAYELWEDLNEKAGGGLFVKNGVIITGDPASETILGLRECYARHDLPHEEMTAQEAWDRFRPYRVPEGHTVFHDPLGGYLRVEDCVRHYLDSARTHGAEIFFEETRPRWNADASSVTVTTDGNAFSADRLVLALGPWSGPLLAGMGIELTLLRKMQVWYGAEGLQGLGGDALPCFACETGYGFYYGFPPLDEDGVKLAEHQGGQAVACPEEMDRDLCSDDERPLLRFLSEFMPTLEPSLKRASACLYSMTADGNFIVDRHPEHANVVFAAGLSGHGFKFASVMGEILSDLSLSGSTAQPIGFLGIERLRA